MTAPRQHHPAGPRTLVVNGLEIEVRLDLGMEVRIRTAPSPPPAASRLTGRHSTQAYAPLLSRVNPRGDPKRAFRLRLRPE